MLCADVCACADGVDGAVMGLSPPSRRDDGGPFLCLMYRILLILPAVWLKEGAQETVGFANEFEFDLPPDQPPADAAAASGAGLDEGLLSHSRPRSRLYGEFL